MATSKGIRCHLITWPLSFSPLGGSLSTPAGRPDGAGEEPQLSRMPTACLLKPGAAGSDFLGPRLGFPNRGLRLQPAATGRPGGAPSGTGLGTQTPVEDSNCNRIRPLEGRRPRIGSPVLLRNKAVPSPPFARGIGRHSMWGFLAYAGCYFSPALSPGQRSETLVVDAYPKNTLSRPLVIPLKSIESVNRPSCDASCSIPDRAPALRAGR
jgi:hypothetical protein